MYLAYNCYWWVCEKCKHESRHYLWLSELWDHLHHHLLLLHFQRKDKIKIVYRHCRYHSWCCVDIHCEEHTSFGCLWSQWRLGNSEQDHRHIPYHNLCLSWFFEADSSEMGQHQIQVPPLWLHHRLRLRHRFYSIRILALLLDDLWLLRLHPCKLCL